jgi:hypothetical protein
MKNAHLTQICVTRAATPTKYVTLTQELMVAIGVIPLCRGRACISMKSARGHQRRVLDVVRVTKFAAVIQTLMVTIGV